MITIYTAEYGNEHWSTEELLLIVTENINKGATRVELGSESEYDSHNPYLRFYYEREETEEERIERESTPVFHFRDLIPRIEDHLNLLRMMHNEQNLERSVATGDDQRTEP